jgi:hypothetical protein
MKIAYFDYWTVGISNFVSYDRELKARGHQTMLLHLGSLRAQVPREETIDGILCRDISWYDTSLFHSVLERERPDVLVNLNAKSLMDRSVFLSCRKLGIKTIFVPHGVNAYVDEPDLGVALLEKSFNGFWSKMSRGRKYLSSVIPNYLYSIFHISPATLPRALWIIYSYFHNPGRAVILPSFIDELVTDKILAFSNRSREHFIKIGYPAERIRVVGNHRYDRLLRRRDAQDFHIEQLPATLQPLVRAGEPYALILDDAFPEMMNLGGWTHEYRNEHFNKIAARLAEDGYRAVFKLHPGSEVEHIHITHPGALAFHHADLDALIYHAKFCISHNSTTVENSLLLDKPVLQPFWGLSCNVPDYFARRSVSNYWRALSDPLDLTVDQAARERHKRECITVLKPVAAENVARELTEWGETRQPEALREAP